jgi:hypothetical protein
MTYIVSETCMLIDIGLSRAECASWVQAWGAVGAILVSTLVAILVARKQANDALQLERDRQRREIQSTRLDAARRLIAIKNVAMRVSFYCKTLEDTWKTVEADQNNYARIFESREFFEFPEYKSLVQSFSLVDMPVPDLIGEMSSLASYMDRATRTIELANAQLSKNRPINPGLWPNLNMQLKDARETADSVVDTCTENLAILDKSRTSEVSGIDLR